MSWISRLFGKKDTIGDAQPAAEPTGIAMPANAFAGLEGIRFGRYSDNNKSYQNTQNWYRAEDLFKEKKYDESHLALFTYLRDDAEDNVHFSQEGANSRFDIVQGSKKVSGRIDGEKIVACVPLAQMEQPNVAVMRRLLDLNYSLYYSRTALDEHNNLCMLFDTSVASANTNKLYYALREMATKADRMDDILLEDFNSLKPAGVEHIQPLGAHEAAVKYKYFKKWITDTLALVESLNKDTFSGAIAYLQLTLIYRIDFLIIPEGRLLCDMEKISTLYWEKKDEIPLVERNQAMTEAIQKLLAWTEEDFNNSVYRSTGTFAVSTPPPADKMKDHVNNGIRDSRWYIENKYTTIGLTLTEYGLLYNQYIYSMPRVITNLTTVLMAVLHPDFFAEMGMAHPLYNSEAQKPDKDAIAKAIDEALEPYRDKYKQMSWDNGRLNYNSLYDFAIAFGEQAINLNLEVKR